MGWFKKFRAFFVHLYRDPPGERFARHHERFRHQNGDEPALRKYMLLALGVVMVVTGIAMLVLPGPGLLTILVGLVIIAARARGFAYWLDRSETAMRSRIPERFRPR